MIDVLVACALPTVCAAPSVQESCTLTGTAVWIDEKGDRRRVEDADVRLEYRPHGLESEAKHVTWIHVVDGNWKLELPCEASFRVDGELIVGLGPARIELDAWLPVADADGIELVAELFPRTTLHVVDAETGRELEGVEVVRPYDSRQLRGYDWLGRLSPPRGPETRDRFDSPFELEAGMQRGINRMAWLGCQELYLRVEGYEWGSLLLDPEKGGERTIALRPAVDLRVSLDRDYDLPKRPTTYGVSLHRASSEAALASVGLHEEQPFELGAVPEGDYELRASARNGSKVWELARVPLSVATGESGPRTVELSLDDSVLALVRTGCPVRGTLLLADGWGEEPTDVEGRDGWQGSSFQVAAMPGVKSTWELPDARSGSLRLEIGGGGLHVNYPLDLAALPLAIEVPAPVDVEVRTFDETGESIPVDEIEARFFGASSTFESGVPSKAGGQGQFWVRTLPGTLELRHGSRAGHALLAVEVPPVAVVGALLQVDLTVHPDRGVGVRMHGDRGAIPAMSGVEVELLSAPVGGELIEAYNSILEGYLKITLSRPGLYRLRIHSERSGLDLTREFRVPEQGYEIVELADPR